MPKFFKKSDFNSELLTLALLLSLHTFPTPAQGSWAFCRRILGTVFRIPPPRPVSLPGPGFGVRQSELDLDVKKGILNYQNGEWSYLDNGYRRKLSDLQIVGKDRFDLTSLDYETDDHSIVELMYVVTLSGEVIVGRSAGPQIYRDYEGRVSKLPHATLADETGRLTRVLTAGTIRFKDGKIIRIDNGSGHYHPESESVTEAKKAFAPYSQFFHSQFEGFIFNVFGN